MADDDKLDQLMALVIKMDKAVALSRQKTDQELREIRREQEAQKTTLENLEERFDTHEKAPARVAGQFGNAVIASIGSLVGSGIVGLIVWILFQGKS